MHIPIYKSKKFLVFGFTAVCLFAALLLHAPESVSSKLAEALMLGLPVLIGGQSFLDHKSASTPVEPAK